ncbi:MAG: hypothetical protein H6R26_1561 [Proteobacteria bacterium]|nr:hypothetical protein [Pseudomonadota bacterium]
MNKRNGFFPGQVGYLLILSLLLIFGASTTALAANLTGLTVIGVNRNADGTTTEVPVAAYRWLVEEDLTYHVGFDAKGQPIGVPGTAGFDSKWLNTLSVSFHRSYMPVVAKGCVGFAARRTGTILYRCCRDPATPLEGLDSRQTLSATLPHPSRSM